MARWNRTGTATVTNGSDAVTGTLTAWLSTVKPADSVTFDGGVTWYEVATVPSNTSMTLGSVFSGASGAKSGASGLFAVANTSPAWSRNGDTAFQVAQLLERIQLFPQPIAGDALKLLRINGAANGYELASSVAAWGGITGTLSAQTDLQTALDARAALSHTHAIANVTGLQAALDARALITSVRERLTAPRTYYVSPSGNDTNSGLSAGAAFKTVSRAAFVCAQIDANGFAVAISIAAGTFDEAVYLPVILGASGASMTGAGATTRVRSVTAAQFSAWTVGSVGLGGLTTPVYAAEVQFSAQLSFGADVSFYAASVAHVACRMATSSVRLLAAYSVLGSATYHVLADGGNNTLSSFGVAVSIPSALAFTAWIYVAYGVSAVCGGMTFTGAGVAGTTGTRYFTVSGSHLSTGGGGPSYFPGNAGGFADATSDYV